MNALFLSMSENDIVPTVALALSGFSVWLVAEILVKAFSIGDPGTLAMPSCDVI